jgi:hypothetical protein
LAAAVTFRKDPPLKEKAAWILLIALVMKAEISNLYLADKEQAGVFSSIQQGLDKTKQGLDQTVIDLRNVGEQMGTVSDHVDKGVVSSKLAADSATEGVNMMTGGHGFCYIEIASDPRPSVKEVLPLVKVIGKYPLSDVMIRVVDYRAFSRDIGTYLKSGNITPTTISQLDAAMTSIGRIPATGTFLLIPIGIDLNAAADEKDYNIEFFSLNGNWREYLRSKKIDGIWYSAVRVVRFDGTGEKRPYLFERIDKHMPRTATGGFDWN